MNRRNFLKSLPFLAALLLVRVKDSNWGVYPKVSEDWEVVNIPFASNVLGVSMYPNLQNGQFTIIARGEYESAISWDSGTTWELQNPS